MQKHEFASLLLSYNGANPFDVLESFDDVEALKKLVIMLSSISWWKGLSLSIIMLQRYCRKFVDKGADLVICQHSHCIGSHEGLW